jgi:beta-lactamase regulating signal transducer with metallopeptidase domain
MNTESIFPVLLELLAKSGAIALAATLLLRAWRDVTAAQRHLVWFVALATITLLPLTRLVSPRWAIAMQPARKVTVTMPAISTIPVETVEMESTPHETVTPITVHTPVDWRNIILGCWFVGAMGVFARRFAGSWRLRRLLARSVRLNDERVRAMADRIFQELGIRQHPDLRLSAECRVPITWGVLRPRMLLPVASLEWSDTWLVAALRHESAHIRRRDYLARWVAHLACAIYWPNPFVWLLARSLRLAQKQAADDLVLRAGTPAEDYATQLVEAARIVAAHGFFVRQAVAMACPSTLEHRVRAIVDGRRDRRPLSMLAASLGSAAITFALALCTAAQLVGADQAPASSGEPSGARDTASGKLHAKEPQIQIEAKFFEIEPDVFKQAGIPQADVDKAIYSDPQFQVIVRILSQKKAGDLISSPRIVTRSNQRATMEIGREFRSPISWEKDAATGGWKPKDFESKNVGVTVELTPKLQTDGTIAMPVTGRLVEFLGYENLDKGTKTAATKARPGDISALDIGPVDPHGDLPDLRGTPSSDRIKSIFSERAIADTITLKSGETVALSGFKQVGDVRPFDHAGPQRKLIVFITASVIDGEPHTGAPAADEKASAAPAPDKHTEEAASKIIIPEFELHEATVQDAAAILGQKSQEMQPGERAVGVAVEIPAATKTLRITLALKNIPLLEAAHLVADLAGLQVVVRPGIVVLSTPPSAGATSAAPSDSTKNLVTKEWKVPTNLIPPKPGGDGVERQSTKEWLAGGGVHFDGDATAIYIEKSSRLIVRNTQDQLDRVDRLIAERMAALPPAQEADQTPAPVEEGPAMKKAKAIIIPKIELREATLAEALDFLRMKAKELDPEKTGVNLVLEPGATSDAKITVSLVNIPLLEALHYVASLANFEYQVQPNAIVVQPSAGKTGTNDGGTQPAPGSPQSTNPAPSEEGPALTKAKAIIVPRIEFQAATLAEALEYLRTKAKELDPEKTGVNFVVKPGATSDAKITLSLTNAPLLEAARYIASLANFELQVQPHAIVMQPMPGKDGVAPSDHKAEPGQAKDDAERVEITANSTRMENGIAVAEGDVVLNYGKQTMKADQIRYDPTTRLVNLTGNVEVNNGTNVLKVDRVTLWLTADGRKKISGLHVTNLSAPPAAGSPGSATVNAGTSPVAVTLAPQGTFKDNDGIEIRETTGTSSTFRVGGTYRVRGVCRQSSLEHATLLLGNTAAGEGEAVKPVGGTALSRDIPKGHTEFEFTFTPTRPGKLHITIYEMDNHNPTDNAYAGIYLGEVAP